MHRQTAGRTFGALSLLAVICLQWIGGSLCLSRAFYVVAEDEMDQTEQAIAGEVFDQYGISTPVKTVTAEEIANLHLLGYAAPFIHTIQLENEDFSFTLDGAPSRTESVTVRMNSSGSDTQHEHEPIQPERLFAQYCMSVGNPGFVELNTAHAKNFRMQSMYDRYTCALVPPPPRHIS